MRVKICPICGSTRIKIPPAGLDIKMTIQNYCLDCGYRGTCPLIEKNKIKEFRKKLKNKK